MNEKIPLSEDLQYWRAERPDEWVMDKFICKAKKLELMAGQQCAKEQAVEADADCICPKFSDGTKIFPQRTCDACKGSA